MDETWKQLYTRIAADAEGDAIAAENARDNAADLRHIGRKAGRFAERLPDD